MRDGCTVRTIRITSPIHQNWVLMNVYHDVWVETPTFPTSLQSYNPLSGLHMFRIHIEGRTTIT